MIGGMMRKIVREFDVEVQWFCHGLTRIALGDMYGAWFRGRAIKHTSSYGFVIYVKSVRGGASIASSEGQRQQRNVTIVFNFAHHFFGRSRSYPCHPAADTLAPSPKVFAYLLRRGRIPASSMALVSVEPVAEAPHAAPPQTIITPCDPWPRPYYLEDGLRRVAPYHYTYNTNVKQRWRGRGILDIFRDEFRDRPEEYYVCVGI
nr:rna pseudouridine synthase 7 [Quercus suber]